MFGWFRRRQKREQLKLLYQNDLSLAYLLGYFEKDPKVESFLKDTRNKNQLIARSTATEAESVNYEDLEWLLEANRELRRLYSTTVAAKMESFDKYHAPPEGWRLYLAEAENSYREKPGRHAGKPTSVKNLWEGIGSQLLSILAFPRHENGGRVPEALKNSNYVLGYHFMMCMNLYTNLAQGKKDPEEAGFVLMNSLSMALEMDPVEISKKIEPLMADPDSGFKMGAEDANRAFAMFREGNGEALLDFNSKIRSAY